MTYSIVGDSTVIVPYVKYVVIKLIGLFYELIWFEITDLKFKL